MVPKLRVARPTDDLEVVTPFTRALGHTAGRAPTKDHLRVFHLPDAEEWEAAVRQMKQAGFEPVRAFNPYWDQQGVTFEDPDGYRVVLQYVDWTR